MVSFVLVSQLKSYMHFSLPPMCATCPLYLILLDLIIIITHGKPYKFRSSSLCILQPSIILSLLIQNILFSNLFLNTISLCSSHKVRDQTYAMPQATCSIVFCNLHIFVQQKRRQKTLNEKRELHRFNLLLTYAGI